MDMNERDEHVLQTATDRFERRLAQEIGGVRTDIAGVRTEIVERSHELLKWMLVFWISTLGAMAAMLSLYK